LSGAANSLAGSWTLITGSGRRIGATIAGRLHAAGANIAVHYFKSSAEADELADRLNAARAGSAFSIGADLRSVAEITRLVERVIAHTGRLDALVNNASSFYPTELGNVTEADWDDLVDSNLKAPLFLCQAALPHLRASRGTIVNMIDIHALRKPGSRC
jgi:pteridine reductase